MTWIVTGTAPHGEMSEHCDDEQHALEVMYQRGSDPAYDLFTFSAHPAEGFGWG